MTLQVYGITNCSTVKKARTWLEENGIDYIFHDYKKEPASIAQLEAWEKEVSWERLLNKKGTTWRKLSTEEQEAVINANSANQVLTKNNSMIKRPLIESPKGIILGFDEAEYQEKLK